MLGHGQTSRLHRRLVRGDELAEAASASTMGLIGGTSMGYAYARARDGVPSSACTTSCSRRCEQLVTDGVTEIELRRAKAQFERHWLHELARIDSRADAFGEFATLHDDPAWSTCGSTRSTRSPRRQVAAALQTARARRTARP